MRAFVSRHLKIVAIISLCALAMWFALNAAAQPGGRGVRRFPAGMAEARLARDSAESLGLSEEVVASLEDLLTEVRAEEERLRIKSEEVDTALQTLLDSNRPAKSALLKAAEEVAKFGRETRALRVTTSFRVRELLNDEQLAEYMELRGSAFGQRRLRGRRGGRPTDAPKAGAPTKSGDAVD